MPGYKLKISLKKEVYLGNLKTRTFAKYTLDKEQEADQVREMIERGIMVPSTSPYDNNELLVQKKRKTDGT